MEEEYKDGMAEFFEGAWYTLCVVSFFIIVLVGAVVVAKVVLPE